MELSINNVKCLRKEYLVEGVLEDGKKFSGLVRWSEAGGLNMSSDDLVMANCEATVQEKEDICSLVMERYVGGGLG